jgi:UTP--glucose-1-phosphate uridylyltransferase
MPKFQIRTAVFPVAGRGTRFLPATKASPKEMLPIVDKPLIQYAAEEALAAGATRLVFITGASKHSIADHFDTDQELEDLLEAQGKSELLRQVRSVLPSYATCIFIRQPAPLGLGHAVLCAEAAVGREPFFVHLADDLIVGEEAVLKQMGDAFDFHRGSLLGVEEVPKSDTDKYGIVKVENNGGQVSRITKIVEKPKPAVAPSNLAVVGRYVLTPRLFDHLRRIGQGAGGEIQLTDGIASLMGQEAVYAHRFVGKRYDCGSKLGYLEATVEQALQHPALHKDFRSYLLRLTRQLESGTTGDELAGKSAGAKKGGRKAGTRAGAAKAKGKAPAKGKRRG